MAHRAKHPGPLIVSQVIANKGACWNEETQKVARTDAQRVLESMVAEFGVEAAVSALNNQGFKGDAMRYLLNPLYEEAMRRRELAQCQSASPSEGEGSEVAGASNGEA